MFRKKKQPKRNPFAIYMDDRKRELEREGYRFPGGLSDIAATAQDEWDKMDAGARDPYMERAKRAKDETEPRNQSNWNTLFGGATNHEFPRRQTSLSVKHQPLDDGREEMKQIHLERAVVLLTLASEPLPPEERNFIIIHTIESCKVLRPDQTISYLPIEIALAVFSLKEGVLRNYWTLVDTGDLPEGTRFDAKMTSEATGVPTPGDERVFNDGHRDYRKILINIKRFIEEHLLNYEDKYVLFTMDDNLKSARGCLGWLYENAELLKEEKDPLKDFANKLDFYPLDKLLIKFAKIAKKKNPGYNNPIACFENMIMTARKMMNKGIYDFHDYLACEYHNKLEPSPFMDQCCRNKALRRVYIILDEIIPVMMLKKVPNHDVRNFFVGPTRDERIPRPSLYPVEHKIKTEPKGPQPQKESEELHRLWRS